MRILHIAAGLPPGGGIAESVPALCRHLRQLSHEVTLATLDGPMSEAALAAEAVGVRLVRFRPSWPRALFFSWQMLWQLRALCASVEVVHVHSQWTFPVWWGCRCALRAGKIVVMSPRGCLNPVCLRHAAWKKRLVGWLDRRCLRRADVIHATSVAEAAWVAAYCDHAVVAMESVKERDSPAVGAMGRVKEECPQSGLKRAGGRPQIVVIPNGVEMGAGGARREAKRGGVKTVLYLGRLHPLKGLELLVAAFCDHAVVAKKSVKGERAPAVVAKKSVKGERAPAVVAMESVKERDAPAVARKEGCKKERGQRWRLVIAGPDEQGTRARLEHIATTKWIAMESVKGSDHEALAMESVKGERPRSGLQSASEKRDVHEVARKEECKREQEPDILFTGPVYGEEKVRLLAEADLFVLPSRSENFGIVVAEALAAGVPVITTQGTPWAELEAEGCGWWVEVGVEPLAKALREAMGLSDEERQAMGEAGRRLVEQKYRWEGIAGQMSAAYCDHAVVTMESVKGERGQGRLRENERPRSGLTGGNSGEG